MMKIYPDLADAAISAVARKRQQRDKILQTPWKFHTGEPPPPPRWLIKGILPETGAALIAGQWGVYKSTTAVDLCVSVMTGKPFAGKFRVKRKGAVLFIALEGANALINRLEATATHRGADEAPLPFAWRDDCPALTDDDAVTILCALADEAKEEFAVKFNLPIALIVIDTIIVTAQHKEGGDNDAAASRQVVSVMAELSRHTGALVVGLDHFGKVIETGTRGSSAKEGGVDAILALLADREIGGAVKNTRLAVRKQREGISGFEIPFSVRVEEIDRDEDDDPVTVQIIDWQAPQQPDISTKTRPTKTMRTLIRVMASVLADHGQSTVPFIDGPSVKACDIALVRAEFYRQHACEGTDKQRQNTKQAFHRAVDDSKDRGIVGVREIDDVQLIWFVRDDAQANLSADDF